MFNLYSPEPYWNAVAERIKKRGTNNILAGDEGPYYQYKRNSFLELLFNISFENKTVLELGSGPGGNLMEVYSFNPKELFGTDISQAMIDIAQQAFGVKKITLVKTDGWKLAFPDLKFNISFTSTVLQHVTDEAMLNKLVAELCRVTGDSIYIFERTERIKRGNESNTGRTIKDYETLFNKNGFFLQEIKFLKTGCSKFVCGAIRKLFNPRSRKEGEQETKLAVILQKFALLFTKPIDKVFRIKGDLTMLNLTRKISE